MPRSTTVGVMGWVSICSCLDRTYVLYLLVVIVEREGQSIVKEEAKKSKRVKTS
jgi:hypothetical protein